MVRTEGRIGSTSGRRGISPTVGVVLLVGIVLLLAVVAAGIFFDLSEETAPAPNVRIELAAVDGGCNYELRHRSGDPIDGDRTTVRGVDQGDVLQGREFAAGDGVTVTPEADTVRVTWESPDTDETYTIATADVGEDGGGAPAWKCSAGTVYTRNGGDVRAVGGDDGSVVPITTPGTVEALGPTRVDLTGDGSEDTPYVDGSNRIRLTNESNASTTLATSSDISGTIAADKTRLWAGAWNGSDDSVFFVDKNHDTIYRVAPDGSPVTVATPADGAQAITGAGDIDGDGTEELVFADASQQLRYVEPGGTVKNVDDGQTGSNNGIGAGSLADFDGDGTVAVVSIDGSNDLKITGEPTASGGEGTTIVSAVDAAKSPVTVADVDDDGNDEVVYTGLADGKIKYVDDVYGSNTVRFLRDADGNKIDAEDDTGVA